LFSLLLLVFGIVRNAWNRATGREAKPPSDRPRRHVQDNKDLKARMPLVSQDGRSPLNDGSHHTRRDPRARALKDKNKQEGRRKKKRQQQQQPGQQQHGRHGRQQHDQQQPGQQQPKANKKKEEQIERRFGDTCAS